MNITEYQAAQAAVGEQTEQKVAALYGVYASTHQPLTRQEFAGFLGVLIGNANARAAVFADVFQSRRLHKKPYGIGRPSDEPDALAEAVAVVLADDPNPLPRLRRLARTEPVQASRQAARTVLEDNGVKHYRWQPSSENPCGLCGFLARRRWPVSKVPVSHPSCSCQIVPA